MHKKSPPVDLMSKRYLLISAVVVLQSKLNSIHGQFFVYTNGFKSRSATRSPRTQWIWAIHVHVCGSFLTGLPRVRIERFERVYLDAGLPKATTNPSFAERIALAFITIAYLIHGSRPWCSGAHLAGQPHTCVRFAALFLLMQVAEYCGPRRLGSSIRPLCDDAEPWLFHGWSDNQERSSEYLSFSKAFPKRLLFSVSPTAEDCFSAWPR